MKKLWRWFLNILKRMLGIGQGVKEEKKEVDINELRFSSRSMFRKFGRYFRGMWRTTAGPNMPKMQRCPSCHGQRKRDRKTVAGAIYKCNPCDLEFLVVNKAAAVANAGRAAAEAI